MFIGHSCSKDVLAAVGMGNVLISAFCMAFCFGLNGTLESKISQAYGANNYEMCGVWLNRGRKICSFIFLPIACLFYGSEMMLKAIGMDQNLAANAKVYSCMMLPGLWAAIQFDATKRFCTSQLRTSPPFFA